MSGLRGVFAGALTLIALEAVLSSRQATARTTGALSAVAIIVARLLDPTVPALPDRRHPTSTSSIGSASSTFARDVAKGAEAVGGAAFGPLSLLPHL